MLSETKIANARAEHRCIACGGTIGKGSPYVRWTGLNDGQFDSVAYHPDCREAEIAWNDHLGTFYDEWQSLFCNREPEDDAWLLDQFPAVAARLGIMKPTPTPAAAPAAEAGHSPGEVLPCPLGRVPENHAEIDAVVRGLEKGWRK